MRGMAEGVEPLTGWPAARFGLYIHFPWCLKRCPYCDFAVTVQRTIPQERYAQAVLAELRLRLEALPHLAGRALDSVFLGGGTPSLWEPALVGRVLEEVARHFHLPPEAELSIEANPTDADAARYAGFRAAGLNRLSLGVQSFEDTTLRALGREHDGEMAVRAIAAAQGAGFPSVSLDLIYGVHGQTVEQVARDAGRAVSLGTPHLSAYALTLEREALAVEVPLARQLARGEVHLPPDESVVEMARVLEETYARAGLTRYEVSNFAKAGFHSRHNSLYWTGGEYLALGAGAAGFFLTEEAPEEGGTGVVPGVRYSNLRSAEKYLQAVEAGRLPEDARETLSREERFAERLSLGLRLASGVDVARLCALAGKPLAARAGTVRLLVGHGLATERDGRLALTPRGLDVHSAVCARLL
jgi:putative oxygen-independent coproporphyrinogen III oxidase